MTTKQTRVVRAVYEALVDSVRNNLTPDLLKPEFRDTTFPTGHCYVASEAIYHLLGGASSGLKPVRMKMPDGVVHWWLQDQDGNVIDPTHDQFDNDIPYDQGRPGGFLTREPSKRAQEVINRVADEQDMPDDAQYTAKLSGYEQQLEAHYAGTQPVEIMVSDGYRGDYQYNINDGERSRVAWCFQDGTLYIGDFHKDIMREMRFEGLNPRQNALFGWIDPHNDKQEWSTITDYGVQDESLIPVVTAFFNQYPPQTVLNYARTGVLAKTTKWKLADDFATPSENPVSYQFTPLTSFELEQFNALDPTQKRWWHRKANKLNVYSKWNRGQVGGQELYALSNRYQGNCAYCGQPGATSWDHVIPLRAGGTNTIDNLLPCHVGCNQDMNEWDMQIQKGRVPVTASTVEWVNTRPENQHGSGLPWIYIPSDDILYLGTTFDYHREMIRNNNDLHSFMSPDEYLNGAVGFVSGRIDVNGHLYIYGRNTTPGVEEVVPEVLEALKQAWPEIQQAIEAADTGDSDDQIEESDADANLHIAADTPTVLRVKTPRTKLRGVYGMPFTYFPQDDTITLADSHTFHTKMWKSLPTNLHQQIKERRPELINGHIVPIRGQNVGGVQFYTETQDYPQEQMDRVFNALAPYAQSLPFDEEEYVEPEKHSPDQLSLIAGTDWDDIPDDYRPHCPECDNELVARFKEKSGWLGTCYDCSVDYSLPLAKDRKEGRVKAIVYEVTGFGGYGGPSRRPVVYDPATDTAYVGPKDASHSSLVKQMKSHAQYMTENGFGYNGIPELDTLSYAGVDRDGWTFYEGDIPEHIQREVEKVLNPYASKTAGIVYVETDTLGHGGMNADDTYTCIYVPQEFTLYVNETAGSSHRNLLKYVKRTLHDKWGEDWIEKSNDFGYGWIYWDGTYTTADWTADIPQDLIEEAAAKLRTRQGKTSGINWEFSGFYFPDTDEVLLGMPGDGHTGVLKDNGMKGADLKGRDFVPFQVLYDNSDDVWEVQTGSDWIHDGIWAWPGDSWDRVKQEIVDTYGLDPSIVLNEDEYDARASRQAGVRWKMAQVVTVPMPPKPESMDHEDKPVLLNRETGVLYVGSDGGSHRQMMKAMQINPNVLDNGEWAYAFLEGGSLNFGDWMQTPATATREEREQMASLLNSTNRDTDRDMLSRHTHEHRPNTPRYTPHTLVPVRPGVQSDSTPMQLAQNKRLVNAVSELWKQGISTHEYTSQGLSAGFLTPRVLTTTPTHANRLDPHPTLPFRVPPEDTETRFSGSHNFSSFSGKQSSDFDGYRIVPVQSDLRTPPGKTDNSYIWLLDWDATIYLAKYTGFHRAVARGIGKDLDEFLNAGYWIDRPTGQYDFDCYSRKDTREPEVGSAIEAWRGQMDTQTAKSMSANEPHLNLVSNTPWNIVWLDQSGPTEEHDFHYDMHWAGFIIEPLRTVYMGSPGYHHRDVRKTLYEEGILPKGTITEDTPWIEVYLNEPLNGSEPYVNIRTMNNVFKDELTPEFEAELEHDLTALRNTAFPNSSIIRDALTLRISTHVQYVPEGAAKIDSDRVPVVYDPSVDTVYIGDRGGTHPYLFVAAGQEHMHMGEVPIKRKELYNTFSAGIYAPEGEIKPYAQALPGYMQWFHGPFKELNDPSVDEAIKNYVESNNRVSSVFEVESPTGPYFLPGHDAVIYDPATGDLYVCRDGSHRTIFKQYPELRGRADELGFYEARRYQGTLNTLDDAMPSPVNNEYREQAYKAYMQWLAGSRIAEALDPEDLVEPDENLMAFIYDNATRKITTNDDVGVAYYHPKIIKAMGVRKEVNKRPQDFIFGWAEKDGQGRWNYQLQSLEEENSDDWQVKNNALDALEERFPGAIPRPPGLFSLTHVLSSPKPELHSWVYLLDTGQLLISDTNDFVNHRQVLQMNDMKAKDLKNRPFIAGQLWFTTTADKDQAELTLSSDYLSYSDEPDLRYIEPDPYDLPPQRAIKAVTEWFKEHYPGYTLIMGRDDVLVPRTATWVSPISPGSIGSGFFCWAYLPVQDRLYIDGVSFHSQLWDEWPELREAVKAKEPSLWGQVDVGWAGDPEIMLQSDWFGKADEPLMDEEGNQYDDQGQEIPTAPMQQSKYFYKVKPLIEKWLQDNDYTPKTQDEIEEEYDDPEKLAAVQPVETQWIGEPSRNAIFVWHIPTNKLYLAPMFGTYHSTIMKELEPGMKFKDSFKNFLLGEIDNLTTPDGNLVEISDREGHLYPNPDVVEAVTKAYNESGGASLPPGHPGITSAVHWMDSGYDEGTTPYVTPQHAFIYRNGDLYVSKKWMTHPDMLRQLGLKARDLADENTAAGWVDTQKGYVKIHSWEESELNETNPALEQQVLDAVHEVFPDLKYVTPTQYHQGSFYEFVPESEAESRWGGLPFVITHEGKVIVSDDPEEHHRRMMKNIGGSAHDIATAGVIYPDGTFTILWDTVSGDIDEVQDILSEQVPDSVWDGGGHGLDTYAATARPSIGTWDGSWFYLPDTDELFASEPGSEYSQGHTSVIRNTGIRSRLREEPFVAGWYTYPEELKHDEGYNTLLDRSQGIKVVPWGSDWLNKGGPKIPQDESVLPRVVELSKEKFPGMHFTD